ncbi:MAG: hypothetical protein V5A28_04045 [Haloarculaceae archaeon]
MSASTRDGVDLGRATSVEMDAEAAAVLGYVLTVVALVVVVVAEEENEFVRFHVFQAAAYNVVLLVAVLGLVVLGTVLVSVGVLLVFLLVGLSVLAAVPSGGSSGAVAGFGSLVLSLAMPVVFLSSFGAAVVFTLLPVVVTVPALGYLVYAAYRASRGDRYGIPYIGAFVEQYA